VTAHPVVRRVQGLDWDEMRNGLDADGYALSSGPVLDTEECDELVAGFDDDDLFRSTVDMARHRFGQGVYRYYRYPLPAAVEALRRATYPHLAAVANDWARMLGDAVTFPEDHAELVRLCNQRGQSKATPLILRYQAGGWNALHQDLYGEVAFPLQLTVALTRPAVDFAGGENLFVEQRPRSQSRGTAVIVPRGHAVIFPTRHRPVAGARGTYRATMRHGVSTVTSGPRFTLGVIFHEAA